mgnify:CR=1 FL=1
MKGIKTLIKLARRELDELKRKQVALEQEKDKLEQAVVKLQQELQREMKMAAENPHMGSFYGNFAKQNRERQQELQAEIKKVEAALLAMAEHIMEAFANVKKYEIAEENDRARKRADAARRENIEMDDMAAMQFIRQQKE